MDTNVQKAYAHKTAIRLKDLHNYVTKKNRGMRPMWMSRSCPRADDEERCRHFRMKLEQAMKNWRGGALDRRVEASHC